MTRPMAVIGRPRATAGMPRIIASGARSTSSRASSLTSPTQKVASVSPCTPPMYAVTSTLMMSPSSSTVVSGMPWQITSLSEVQHDFGKPLYPSVDGYAPWSSRNSCTTRSISSVVTPGLQCSPASWVACAAIRPATRIFSMVSGVCTCEPRHSFGRFLPTYSGRTICAGTARHGDCFPGTNGARTVMRPAYRRGIGAYRWRPPPDHRRADLDAPVLAAPGPLCNRVFVDQEGADANFTATGVVTDDRVVVTVTGEVDMSTAGAMFEAATKDNATGATLD